MAAARAAGDRLLRLSVALGRTARERPAEAETQGHALLLQAGYVRRMATRVFAWLPLGTRVLERVTAVVREELSAIGAQEVLLPILVAEELVEATGRTATSRWWCTRCSPSSVTRHAPVAA